MNIYTISGRTKDEFLINAKSVISSAMNGILTFSNETSDSLWYSIVGSANYLRITVSGSDPMYSTNLYLTSTNSGSSYISPIENSSSQLIYLVKFSSGEVGITSSLNSSITDFLNLRLHCLTDGTDHTSYIVNDTFYINDTSQSKTDLVQRGTTGTLTSRQPTFFPYLFTSSSKEWMWVGVLGTFVSCGMLKKMLYNGDYWRQITSGNICYYIKDGE